MTASVLHLANKITSYFVSCVYLMWRRGEGKTEREGDIRPCMDRGGEPLCTVFGEVIQHIFQISSPHQSSWCACSGAKTAFQPDNTQNRGACSTAWRAGGMRPHQRTNTHNSPLHTPHHNPHTAILPARWHGGPERDHGSSQTNACMCRSAKELCLLPLFFPGCECGVTSFEV